MTIWQKLTVALFFVTLIGIASVVSFNNKRANFEQTIEKERLALTGVSDDTWARLNLLATITSTAKTKQIIIDSVAGRYHSNDDFIFDAIGISCFSDSFVVVQRTIERGQDEFKVKQTALNKTTNAYDKYLSSFPHTLYAKVFKSPFSK